MLFGFLRGLVLGVFSFVIYCLFKLVYRKKEISNFIYEVELFVEDKRVKLNMFLDSGNCLYDDMSSGLPILVVSKVSLEEKLNKKIDVSKFRNIRYSTVGEKGLCMPIFSPDRIVLAGGKKERKLRAMIGIADMEFKSFDGLMHSAVI